MATNPRHQGKVNPRLPLLSTRGLPFHTSALRSKLSTSEACIDPPHHTAAPQLDVGCCGDKCGVTVGGGCPVGHCGDSTSRHRPTPREARPLPQPSALYEAAGPVHLFRGNAWGTRGRANGQLDKKKNATHKRVTSTRSHVWPRRMSSAWVLLPSNSLKPTNKPTKPKPTEGVQQTRLCRTRGM